MILKYYTIARSPELAMETLTDTGKIICLSTNRAEVEAKFKQFSFAETHYIFCLVVIAERVK